MSSPQSYPASLQWWFECLEVFPHPTHHADTGADTASREQALVQSFLGEIDRLLPGCRTALYFVQEAGLDLQVRAVNDAAWSSELEQAGAVHMRDGLFAWALKSGRPAVVESTASNCVHDVILLPLMTVRTVIGAGLILRDQALGELSLEQLKILAVLGGQLSFFIENQRLVQRLEAQNQDLERQVGQRTHELEASLGSLQELNREILETTRQKNEFLVTTSHELRAPLNSLIGFLNLIGDGLYDSEEEYREFVRHSLESAQHLLELINDLLALAKIESGKMRVDREIVDLGGLFEEVRALTHVQAQQKGLDLMFEVPERDRIELQAGPRRIRQVLINLIGNAIKGTPDGTVRVRGQRSSDGSSCLITIVDSGGGPPETTSGPLGKAPLQEDTGGTRRFAGKGLGLEISRALIKLMGGTISFTGKGEEPGTTITIRLPLAGPSPPTGKLLRTSGERGIEDGSESEGRLRRPD